MLRCPHCPAEFKPNQFAAFADSPAVQLARHMVEAHGVDYRLAWLEHLATGTSHRMEPARVIAGSSPAKQTRAGVR